jgi:hypothetical protein
MNNNEYLLNQEIKNRRLLLKIYKKQSKKIMEQIYEAALAERSTKYLENLLHSLNDEIKTLEELFREYAKRQTKESYLNGVKQADYQIRQLTLFDDSTVAGFTFGAVNREAVSVLAQATYEPLGKIAMTVGRNVKEFASRENFKSSEKMLKALGNYVDNKTLAKTGIQGVADVVIGSKTWKQGMQKIRQDLIEKGAIKIPYFDKKGNVIRQVSIEDYSKLVARTTTAKIHREGTKDRLLEVYGDNGDLVEITGISKYPDSPCIPYQGKILSLNGDTDPEIIEKLGGAYMGLLVDAEANGLFHPNCIHGFGISDTIVAVYGYEI